MKEMKEKLSEGKTMFTLFHKSRDNDRLSLQLSNLKGTVMQIT